MICTHCDNPAQSPLLYRYGDKTSTDKTSTDQTSMDKTSKGQHVTGQNVWDKMSMGLKISNETKRLRDKKYNMANRLQDKRSYVTKCLWDKRSKVKKVKSIKTSTLLKFEKIIYVYRKLLINFLCPCGGHNALYESMLIS
jgi:hypothetical protein